MKLIRLAVTYIMEDKYTQAWTPGYSAIKQEAKMENCRFSRVIGTDSDYMLVGANLKTLMDLAVRLTLSIKAYNQRWDRNDIFRADFNQIKHIDSELSYFDQY